jgi:F-type H+-transporting ATPase subunit O
LYSATASNNTALNEIEKSLSTIRQKLDSDAKLSSIVVNPALTSKEKTDIVQLLTQTGGGGVESSKAVKNLLGVMAENGRLGHLDGVVTAFEKMMRAHKGEVEVVVTSAQVFLFFIVWD